MSKLYTEEQVRKTIELSRDTHQVFRGYMERHEFDYSMDEVFDLLTPIELPTDEEIKEIAFRYDESQVVLDYINSSPYNDFIDGAKWMRDKIKGGQE